MHAQVTEKVIELNEVRCTHREIVLDMYLGGRGRDKAGVGWWLCNREADSKPKASASDCDKIGHMNTYSLGMEGIHYTKSIEAR